MFKKSICVLGLLLAFTGISSCGGNPTVDVYVTGFYVADVNTGIATPAVWKNGVKTDLTLPAGGNNGYANSVYVSRDSVYVSGYYFPDTGIFAVIWKDGVSTKLDVPAGTIASYANSVYVSNESVYVAGNYSTDGSKYIAAYWKDGVRTDLDVPGYHSQARSIFVEGDTIYVAGKYRNLDGTGNVATVWKNGVRTDLSATGASDAWANSIYVSDGSVYISGYHSDRTDNFPTVWKDGVKTDLVGVSVLSWLAQNQFSSNSIYVSGGNVYVSGFYNNGTNDIPAVWKDGVKTDLSTASTAVTTAATYDAYAYSVSVGNGSAYVCGSYSDGTTTFATVWKDGVKTDLTDATVAAVAVPYSVYVNTY